MAILKATSKEEIIKNITRAILDTKAEAEVAFEHFPIRQPDENGHAVYKEGNRRIIIDLIYKP